MEMKNSEIYIFFDEISADYKNYYGKDSECKLIEDLAKYLAYFHKTTEIMIITQQNVLQVTDWFSKNNLRQLVDNISNPMINGLAK